MKSIRLASCVAAAAIAALTLGLGAVVASGQDSSASSGALFATANGQNVVAQDGTRGAGDPNGFASFTATRSGGRLCYGLTVRGIQDPLAVNLMRGTATHGSIAVRLRAPASGAAGTRAACATVPASVLQAIFANPGSYSINVITDDFRDGAITGTLGRAPATTANGSGRAPISDCGDISMNVAAVTAQGTTCANAVKIAQAAASSQACRAKQSCQARSYTCLLGQAGSELTLVRCENSTQTRFVRFELGS